MEDSSIAIPSFETKKSFVAFNWREPVGLQILKKYSNLHITRFIRSKLTAPPTIGGVLLLISVEKEILKKYQHAYLSSGEGDKFKTIVDCTYPTKKMIHYQTNYAIGISAPCIKNAQ